MGGKMGELANNPEKLKKFKGLVPDDKLTQFINYLEDRVSSSLRKPRAIIYFWDELAVPDPTLPNIYGSWVNMSQFGFSASINYGDIIDKEASTARIECVDATRDEFHPFWGKKRHIFKRGNRFKVVMSERDMPGGFVDVEIPIFEGCVLSSSFSVGRSDNSANLVIEGQVLNFQRIFKARTTTRAYMPQQDVVEKPIKITQSVKKGDMSFTCSRDDARKIDQQGLAIRFQDKEQDPDIQDIYYISTVDLASSGDQAVVHISATKINKTGQEYKYSGFVQDYPAGTFVAKIFTTTQLETDFGWIARDILKNTGYQRLNNLSDQQLEEDIPNTGYYIQNKLQMIDSEIGQMLDDIFLPIGRVPYIDPASGRIKVKEIAKKIKDSIADFTYDLTRTIRFNYNTDLSNQTNVMQVVGLSAHKTMLDKEEVEIASLEGYAGVSMIGGEINKTNYPEHPPQYTGGGWEYIEYTVYSSESRKLKCRDWRIDPTVSKLPNSQLPEFLGVNMRSLFQCEYQCIPVNEYECIARLYFNNFWRYGAYIVVTVSFALALTIVIAKVFKYTGLAFLASFDPTGILKLISSILLAIAENMELAVFAGNLAGIATIASTLLMQGAFRLSVRAIPYEDYHQEISSKTSMPSEILSREGVKMETYNNPIISNYKMGLDCAKFLLSLKRISMQSVDTSSVYDYFVESGDVIKAEVSPGRYENFLVKSLSFDVKRGGDLVANERLGWIDPSLDINSFQNSVVPVIKIKNSTTNNNEAIEGLGSALIPVFKNYYSIDPNTGFLDTTSPGMLKNQPRVPAMQELEVTITNHLDILDAYRATGEDFMYVYAYQSAKMYAESDKELSSLGFNIINSNSSLDAPAILRQSVPSSAIFDAAHLNPSLWSNGVGFSFVGLSEDTNGFSGVFFESDNAENETNVAGPINMADFRRDSLGNKLASQRSGIMFAVPTSEIELQYMKNQTSGLTEGYKRNFYVSLPIPPSEVTDLDKLRKARFFIRVGLIKIERVISGSNIQIVPKFETLVLSNAVQMSVYYTIM